MPTATTRLHTPDGCRHKAVGRGPVGTREGAVGTGSGPTAKSGRRHSAVGTGEGGPKPSAQPYLGSVPKNCADGQAVGTSLPKICAEAQLCHLARKWVCADSFAVGTGTASSFFLGLTGMRAQNNLENRIQDCIEDRHHTIVIITT